MHGEHRVTRRTTLKAIGTMGATVALGASATPLLVAQSPNVGASGTATNGNAPDIAVARMAKGNSCAQAVFSALAEPMGVDYETAMKVSCGFGGGMYLGSVCGAVTGGIMAIGLKHGGPGRQAGVRTATLVREFTTRFKAEHRSINCTELIGTDLSAIDISDPRALAEAYKAALDKNVFAQCPALVRDAARIVDEIVREAPK